MTAYGADSQIESAFVAAAMRGPADSFERCARVAGSPIRSRRAFVNVVSEGDKRSIGSRRLSALIAYAASRGSRTSSRTRRKSRFRAKRWFDKRSERADACAVAPRPILPFRPAAPVCVLLRSARNCSGTARHDIGPCLEAGAYLAVAREGVDGRRRSRQDEGGRRPAHSRID